MGKRKLELVPDRENSSLPAEAETLSAPQQPKQIDWSLYPELYRAKLRRLNRTIDALVAESRKRFQLQDFDSGD